MPEASELQIPPSEEKKTHSIRVAKSILEKVDRIAAERKESGNYIIEKLLEFAFKELSLPNSLSLPKSNPAYSLPKPSTAM